MEMKEKKILIQKINYASQQNLYVLKDIEDYIIFSTQTPENMKFPIHYFIIAKMALFIILIMFMELRALSTLWQMQKKILIPLITFVKSFIKRFIFLLLILNESKSKI